VHVHEDLPACIAALGHSAMGQPRWIAIETGGTLRYDEVRYARGDVRVLTQTTLDESPSVAPNGTMLIYATQDRGRGILGVVSLDGRVRYRLPSSAGDVREPSWSPYLDTLNGGW
jgi:Tol biopolymer transport system component